MLLLNTFDKCSFSKIDCKNSLLEKLPKDYTFSITLSPLTLLLELLMFRTVAHMQAATQYRKKLTYHLLKQLLTQ